MFVLAGIVRVKAVSFVICSGLAYQPMEYRIETAIVIRLPLQFSEVESDILLALGLGMMAVAYLQKTRNRKRFFSRAQRAGVQRKGQFEKRKTPAVPPIGGTAGVLACYGDGTVIQSLALYPPVWHIFHTGPWHLSPPGQTGTGHCLGKFASKRHTALRHPGIPRKTERGP